MNREQVSKAIDQHARLTADVAASIARQSGFTADRVLHAIWVGARQRLMRRKLRNGDEPPRAKDLGNDPQNGAPKEKPKTAPPDTHTPLSTTQNPAPPAPKPLQTNLPEPTKYEEEEK